MQAIKQLAKAGLEVDECGSALHNTARLGQKIHTDYQMRPRELCVDLEGCDCISRRAQAKEPHLSRGNPYKGGGPV